MRRASWVFAATLLLSSCQDDPASSPAQPTAVPPPNLSAPDRFRPSLTSFAASPGTIRVGESATLTATVSPVFESAPVTWAITLEPTSEGMGSLSAASGTGALEARFVATRAGRVAFVAMGIDTRGIATNVGSAGLMVLP